MNPNTRQLKALAATLGYAVNGTMAGPSSRGMAKGGYRPENEPKPKGVVLPDDIQKLLHAEDKRRMKREKRRSHMRKELNDE